VPRSARAEGFIDPSYGRIEGDVSVAVGAGGTIASGGPRVGGELRLRYLETVGLFGTYEDGPLVGLSPDPSRVVTAGFELRPIFLYRWLDGYETRRARIDLTIDSVGLELGMVWAQPEGASFSSRPGVELGLGVEMPITLDASGLWLGFHTGVRWSDYTLATAQASTSAEREFYLAVALAWHQMVVAHVVDVGDRAPR
jgi:hypothetical protein